MNNMDEVRQKLIGIFDELSSKVFGKSLDIRHLDRLNLVAARFAGLIQQAASRAALEKCKLLNDATKLGFGKVAEDIAKLEKRIEDLEKK